ncbi:unnamed protein product [Alternaria alternata]
MFVKNSLCGYRESKKSDKYVVELATRAQDPEIHKLAVEMLNEYHVEVRAAQDDPANQELLRSLKRKRQAQEKQQEAQDELRSGAKVVPEKGLDVDLKNIADSKSKRLRKRPERFSDIKWTDSGKRGATISAEGLRLSVMDLAKWWYTTLCISKIVDRAVGDRHSSCTISSFSQGRKECTEIALSQTHENEK